MPIKLNGATNGSVELDVPAAVGSDLQVTLPATAGEVVVKDSSGNITTTGSATLAGTILSGTANNNNNYAYLTPGQFYVNRTNTSSPAFIVSNSGTTNCSIGADGSATFAGEISSGTSSASLFTRNYSGGSPNIVGGFRAQHEGVDKAVIFADGSATFAGSVSIGGTAAANTIDEYEEGTFTPTFSRGITSPSYSNTGGQYTKIGNYVAFTIRLQVTGTNNGDHLQIAGLPFTTDASATQREGGISFSYTDNINGLTRNIYGHIPANNSVIDFYTGTGATWTGTTENGAANNTYHLRGFYFAN